MLFQSVASASRSSTCATRSRSASVLGFLKSRGSFGCLLIECVQSIVYCDPLLLGIPHFRICLFEALLIAIGYDQLAANC